MKIKNIRGDEYRGTIEMRFFRMRSKTLYLQAMKWRFQKQLYKLYYGFLTLVDIFRLWNYERKQRNEKAFQKWLELESAIREEHEYDYMK